MKFDNLFLVLSAMLAVTAILFAGFTIFSPRTLDNFGITGFLTSNQTSGLVNVSVQTALIINFTVDRIVWGSGRVDPGANNATLDTSRNEANKVINGNWTWINLNNLNRTNGLVIENIGNLNASIWISMAKNATQFIGGTNPAYQFNVTNNESNSCTAAAVTLGQYYEVNATTLNTTTRGIQICSVLDINDARDTIKIDILLRIPSGSLTGELTDTITATAEIA